MILTYAQQQTIKPISANNEAKYAQLATEVENTELRALIGAAFLHAIQTTPSAYAALLDGTTFTDCHGNQAAHRGLRFVLAYLFFSAYMDNSNVADTFTGFVTKNRQEASNLDAATFSRERGRVRQIALEEFELIREYLDENRNAYPLWQCKTKSEIYKPKYKTLRKYGKQGGH